MTASDEIRTVVDRRVDALNRHDVARLGEVFADDCTIESPTAGGTVRGRQAIEQINAAWSNAFPDSRFITEDLLVDEDRAAWIARAEGTGTGEFVGLPPTGKPFSVPMVFVSTFRAGRIAHERRIYDFTGMLVQLGMLRTRVTGSLPPRGRFDPGEPGQAHGNAGASARRDAVLEMLQQRRDAWTRADVDAITGQHARGCVMDSYLEGRIEGPEPIARVYGKWFAAFPNSTVTSDGAIVVDGTRVAECVTMTGTDTGGLLGLPPTGRPFQLPSVWLYTIEANQFVYVRPIYDFTGMLVQIGLLKAKPA